MPINLLSFDEPMFPLQRVEAYFRSFSRGLDRNGNSLRWPSSDGFTELSVTPIDERMSDGYTVSELVTLRHVSPMLQALSPALAAKLNTLATLSSLLPSTGDSPAQLISKIGIFSGDRAAAERVYAPLVCMEAVLMGWHAARISRGQFEVDPATSPLQTTDEKPPFNDADFEAAKALTDARGYLGSLGQSHFTVEFPWDVGAVSNVFARSDAQEELLARGLPLESLRDMSGRTSLLQILVLDHPLYGAGVQSRLEIPFSNDSVTLVDELNRWELSGPDLPPLLGSWCIGQRAPAFVSFVPSQHCLGGLLQNLVVWGFTRHSRVKEWLSASQVSH